MFRQNSPILQIFLVMLLFQNAGNLVAQTSTGLMAKEKISDKEIYVLSLLELDIPLEKNAEKLELSKNIVRYSDEIKFTDSSIVGNEKVDELVFLISFIKVVSNFEKYSKTKYSYGYMAVSENAVREIEKEFNSIIERKHDVFEPALNLKAGVRKWNEILANRNTVKGAFQEYMKNSGKNLSFFEFEKVYQGYMQKKK